MNETSLRRLIRLVEESEIESLEIRKWFRTIRITKRLSGNNNGSGSGVSRPHFEAVLPAHPAPPSAPSASQPAPEQAAPAPPSNLVEVKAPMVGTFYRAPAPGAPPFVDIDKRISPGDTLCIIEAMKLMNEIEAEHSGRITKILIEDGTPIEFGQVMFLLDPAG
jgi:acetyl-CoA carboxylase biotin carboxyl carrier protein